MNPTLPLKQPLLTVRTQLRLAKFAVATHLGQTPRPRRGRWARTPCPSWGAHRRAPGGVGGGREQQRQARRAGGCGWATGTHSADGQLARPLRMGDWHELSRHYRCTLSRWFIFLDTSMSSRGYEYAHTMSLIDLSMALAARLSRPCCRGPPRACKRGHGSVGGMRLGHLAGDAAALVASQHAASWRHLDH